MPKRFTTLTLCLLCLLLAGCNKDEQINSVMARIDSFTTELVKRVDSAPNPAAGVDDAQTYFDSQRADLTASIATLRGLRSSQVSEDVRKKMTASLGDDISRVTNLEIKYAVASIKDPTFKAKLEKLTKDYQSLFKF